MIAPAEDPRGDVQRQLDTVPTIFRCPTCGARNSAARSDVEAGLARCADHGAYRPAAGRGDTDSSGEALPDAVLVEGDWVSPSYEAHARDLTKSWADAAQNSGCPAAFVARMRSFADVHDRNYRAALAARPAGDRAQPTQELRDDQLYLDGIRSENGEMVIDLHDAGQTLAHMALAMRTFWEGNASEGTNYVQTGVVHKGKTWNFVVYPAGKPTPHDLRRKAEAERDQAVAALLDAQAAVNRVAAVMAAWNRGEPVGGYLPREIRRALDGTS